MRHPSLLDFLIEAAKTFRTRRNKLIVIDQQMSVFLEGKARLVFENCPIRVIFSQRQGMTSSATTRRFNTSSTSPGDHRRAAPLPFRSGHPGRGAVVPGASRQSRRAGPFSTT